MGMFVFTCFVLGLFLPVPAYPSDKLFKFPRRESLPRIDPHELIGTWYRYANFIPCSWNGARDFQDGTTTISVDTHNPNMFKIVNNWRSNDLCAQRVEMVSKQDIKRNKVISINNLGGMGSGARLRIAFDSQRYDINWGCAQVDPADPKRCRDPSLAVLVKNPDPSDDTIHDIETKLDEFFKISLSDLVIQTRTWSACP